jgi:hypothetical protein
MPQGPAQIKAFALGLFFVPMADVLVGDLPTAFTVQTSSMFPVLDSPDPTGGDLLEDEISILCTRLLNCDDPAQASTIAGELQKAIHEHLENVRQRFAELPYTKRLFTALWREP